MMPAASQRPRIARGDGRLRAVVAVPAIVSPLKGVPNAAWDKFVREHCTQPLGFKSKAGMLGCFEMHPKRLADIGVMVGVAQSSGIWAGAFKPPMTEAEFLASYVAQFDAFLKSIEAYDAGHVNRDDMTRSGALTILHRAGTGGLKGWHKRKVKDTVELFTRCNGLF